VPRIWLGETKCAACGEVMADPDDVLGFPSFASDTDDPHWRYSDVGLHRACYARLPEREAIEDRLRQAMAAAETGAVGWWAPPDISDLP
jgi:hypothetical protein